MSRRRLALALALALGTPACDLVFDLSRTPPPPDVPLTVPVTGRLRWRHAVNAPDYTPLVLDEAYPDVTMVAHLDDRTDAAVTYQPADGTFVFQAARVGQRYRLEITHDGTSVSYDHTASYLDLVDRGVGRDDRVVVTQPTTIDFSLGAALGFPYVASTGLWTNTYVPVGNSAVASMNWAQAGSLGGPVGLLDAAKHDRLYWTELSAFPSASAPTHYAINAWAETSITQTDGGSSQVTGALTPRGHDLCGHIVAQRGVELARLQPRIEGPFFNSGTDWWIYAVPARDQLLMAGSLVVAQTADGSATDLDVSPTFTNPFTGSDLLVSSAVVFNRQYTVGAAAPTYAGIATREWVPLRAGASCSANLAVLTFGGALPTDLTLAGVALALDGTSVPLSDADPLVTWAVVAGEPVDETVVQLVELTTNPDGTQTMLVGRGMVIATGTRTTLPRAWLEPGKTYLLAVTGQVGFPGAAAGDFASTSYPQIRTTNWSRTFTLGNL